MIASLSTRLRECLKHNRPRLIELDLFAVRYPNYHRSTRNTFFR